MTKSVVCVALFCCNLLCISVYSHVCHYFVFKKYFYCFKALMWLGFYRYSLSIVYSTFTKNKVRSLVREDFLGNILVQFLGILCAWTRPTSVLIRHAVVRLTLDCIDIPVATNNSTAAAAATDILADYLISQQMAGYIDQMRRHWRIIMHSPVSKSPGGGVVWGFKPPTSLQGQS